MAGNMYVAAKAPKIKTIDQHSNPFVFKCELNLYHKFRVSIFVFVEKSAFPRKKPQFQESIVFMKIADFSEMLNRLQDICPNTLLIMH